MSTLKDIQKNIAGKARHATYRNQTTPDGYFAMRAKILGFERIYLLEGEEGEPDAPIIGNVVIWKNRDTNGGELVTYRGSEILGGEHVGMVEGHKFGEAFAQILGR